MKSHQMFTILAVAFCVPHIPHRHAVVLSLLCVLISMWGYWRDK